MTTNAQEAMKSIGKARKAANAGDFATARDYWVDACGELDSAKRAGENKLGAGCEYDQAIGEAQDFLDKYGADMKAAFDDEKQAFDDATERLRALVAEIQKAAQTI